MTYIFYDQQFNIIPGASKVMHVQWLLADSRKPYSHESSISGIKEYYPYDRQEVRMDGLSNTGLNGYSNEYPYKYQGKEYQSGEWNGHQDGIELYDFDARFYEPALGRWFVPDPATARECVRTEQFHNPYLAMGNNPVMYVDPDGEFVWVIPNIGWSGDGGLSLGVSVVVGVPGVFSAQAGVGYSPVTNDAYAYVGVTAALNTVSASYSTNSGFSVGYSAGLTPYSGLPISSNLFTVGANYNITNDTWSGNVSSWQIDQNGWRFNPSVSVMVFPEQTTNLVRGQGFRTNNTVLSRFVDAGKHQQALNYFGFEGTYQEKKPGGGHYVEGNDYFGATHPTTGEISYRNLAFDSYDILQNTSVKEAYHSGRIKSGIAPETTDLPGMKYYPEEAKGFQHAFKREGLYPNSTINNMNNANSYWMQVTGQLLIQDRMSNFIYRIPRKW